MILATIYCHMAYLCLPSFGGAPYISYVITAPRVGFHIFNFFLKVAVIGVSVYVRIFLDSGPL